MTGSPPTSPASLFCGWTQAYVRNTFDESFNDNPTHLKMKTMRTTKNNSSLTGTIITGALILLSNFGFAQTTPKIKDSGKISHFHISVPETAVADLRQRIAATRWPEKETVADQSQGVKLEKIQKLVKYWGTDYNWRNAEAKLNALSQFITTIDGVDIQFVHIRSKHPNAMPLIITHGWPGSIFELLKVVGPLTDPTAYGGRAEDAFDLVLPSMPGYGFSGKPKGTGWGPERIGRAWDVLMKRLGYKHYVAQGGGYAGMMVTRPQTLGYGLSDSPVGLASFFLDKFNEWTYSGGDAGKSLTQDEMLDDISLYWLTNTAASSAQLYWENNNNNFNAAEQKTAEIKIPVAVTVFPGEIYQAPKSWTERSYRNLIYFNEVKKGGHFASWEEPQLFAEEMRAAFRSLR